MLRSVVVTTVVHLSDVLRERQVYAFIILFNDSSLRVPRCSPVAFSPALKPLR
jgi:hypothetical protein